MPVQFFDPALTPIAEKVAAGERLSFDDGLILEGTPDLLGLGWLANTVRERINGNRAYYINNRHINHTNICVNSCRFCAFERKEGEEGAYLWDLDRIMTKAHEWDGEHFTEFHIVGGLHPGMPYDYYREMVRRLHHDFPAVHIQAFTAVEIAWFSKISGMTVEETLRDLATAGLGSLPGGGAEIFHPRVREKICPDPDKPDAVAWLEIHKSAHRLGLNTNATMLYGHIERPEERVDHLIRLREAQDETGGFLTYIPLAFHPKNTEYEKERHFTSGQMDLRQVALGRLMLDNFPHIKAFWIMIGEKIAQVSLAFGADDMDGTVVEEKITHAAGAETAQKFAVEHIERLIREAGRDPVERDTVYHLVTPAAA